MVKYETLLTKLDTLPEHEREALLAYVREQNASEIETRFWSIVDADGLSNLPSDMWAALEQLARAARNRDMWRGQCERQAEKLTLIAGNPCPCCGALPCDWTEPAMRPTPLQEAEKA